ncbi:MAG: hypothetical protein KKA44_11405 [Alphaproteobacteria bacterium]|nr:hypothetical protein [Alphaproteobacteria bacterium]MBU1825570.1 hypothetical protein [Alphaproteobacteria bacterium]
MSDAFAALKNVMLMEERIDGLRSDMSRSADDLRSLTEKVHSLDKRVLRIETMIEMSDRRGNQPRIEG